MTLSAITTGLFKNAVAILRFFPDNSTTTDLLMRTCGKTRLIQLVVIVCGTVLVGCSRQNGKATFEFLKAQHDILESTKLELKKYSYPKPLAAPVFSRQTPLRQRLQAIKAYNDAQDDFLTDVIQDSEESLRVLHDAQTRISALNPADIQPAAIALAKLYEQSLGDGAQVCAEVKALATLERVQLRRNKNKNQELITPLITGVIDGLIADNVAAGAVTFLKGISTDIELDNELRQEIDTHFLHLQEAVATLEQDKSQTITKRSELITSFGAKYPGYPWNSLLPVTTQSSTNR
jgi:hypothetical protein